MQRVSRNAIFALIQEAKDVRLTVRSITGVQRLPFDWSAAGFIIRIPEDALEKIQEAHQKTDSLLSKADGIGLINKSLLESNKTWVGSTISIRHQEKRDFSSLSGHTESNICLYGSSGSSTVDFQRHFKDAVNHVLKAGVRCLKGHEKLAPYGQTTWSPAKLGPVPRTGFKKLHDFLTGSGDPPPLMDMR